MSGTKLFHLLLIRIYNISDFIVPTLYVRKLRFRDNKKFELLHLSYSEAHEQNCHDLLSVKEIKKNKSNIFSFTG